MLVILLAVLALITIIVFLTTLFISLTIRKALKQKIKPELERHGLVYKKHTWLGFFNTGSFVNADMFKVKPMNKNGTSNASLYFDVFFMDNGIEKQFTVKVISLLLGIKSIQYSDEIKPKIVHE